MPVEMGQSPEPGGQVEWSDWFTLSRFALTLGAFLVAAFPGPLLGTESLVYRDFGTFSYPLAYYHRECFWRGELPLWNPLSNCGLPFLAQWNTLVLYPPSLIYLLLPLPWSLNFFCLAHLFLAGMGMYALAVWWCENRFAGSLAGLAFAFGGLSLTSLMWTCTTASLGWMPWVILCVERAWREGGRKVILAGLVAALQMLSGTPEVILLTWLLLGVRLAVELGDRQGAWRSRLVRFSLVVLMVAGLSAAQLLPFLELAAHSQRGAEFAREQDAAASFWTLPFWGWANLLVPLFRCQLTPLGTYVHSTESWVATFYCGAGVLGLAIFAVARVRRPLVWLLAGVATLGWLLALGSKAFLYAWLREVFPPLGAMRYPVKFVVLTVFAAPLLAAFGVSCLHREPGGCRTRPDRAAAAIGGLLLGLMVVVVCVSRLRPIAGESWPTTIRSGLQSGVFLVLILGGVCWLPRIGRSRTQLLLSLAVLTAVSLDGLTHMPRLIATVPVKALEPKAVTLDPQPQAGQSRALASLEALRRSQANLQPDLFRQFALTRLGLMFSCNLLEGIPVANGFFPLYLRETAEVEARLLAFFPNGLADFLGISQVTAPETMTTWRARPTALPLITTGQRPAFTTPVETLRALAAPDFNPREVVHLSPDVRSEVTATNQTGARIVRQAFSAHRVELSLEAPAPTLVVVAQSYYRPWRAFVDGRPVALWRANHAFQALEVPAGQHEIRLTYQDRLFLAGVILGLLTIGVGSYYWLLLSNNRNRPRALFALAFLLLAAAPQAAEESPRRPVFNGRDLEGWDTWLGPRPSGYPDPANSQGAPIGLNTDPLRVFTVVTNDGAPALRISGQIFGAIATCEEFENVHIRVEYKWGQKKWPPRAEAKHYRRSGILYWCVGPQGAESLAWMRGVECNLMEKGAGQWWSVAGTRCDVHGRRVLLDQAPSVPYRGESSGEKAILWDPQAPQLTATPGDRVTSPVDPEKPPGEWNVCEVLAWGGVALHRLNGQVVIALTNPRWLEAGRDIPLRRGKIQVQSAGAEVFYRKIEVQPLTGIPPELLSYVPSWQDDEAGFQPLLGKDARDGWAQCGPGGFVVSNGVATAFGGMGLWWHTNRMFTNFVLRGEWRLDSVEGDSGVFLRFPDPGDDPWRAVKHGHEMEIGDDPAGKDPAWRTGALYPFSPPHHVPTNPIGQWNRYELVCIGQHYSIRINGHLVTTWTDPQQRTTHGYVGLQNYQEGKGSQHRNLRLKELP